MLTAYSTFLTSIIFSTYPITLSKKNEPSDARRKGLGPPKRCTEKKKYVVAYRMAPSGQACSTGPKVRTWNLALGRDWEYVVLVDVSVDVLLSVVSSTTVLLRGLNRSLLVNLATWRECSRVGL